MRFTLLMSASVKRFSWVLEHLRGEWIGNYWWEISTLGTVFSFAVSGAQEDSPTKAAVEAHHGGGGGTLRWMEQAVVTGPLWLLEMANDKRPAASVRTKMMGLGNSHTMSWGTLLATTMASVGRHPPFAP